MNLLFLPWPWAYGPLQSESAVELSLWGPWENLCGQGCPGEDGQSFCIWKAAWRFWKRSRNEWDGGMKGNEVCFTSTHAYIDIHTICTELFSIFAMLPSEAIEEACKWPSICLELFYFEGPTWGSKIDFHVRLAPVCVWNCHQACTWDDVWWEPAQRCSNGTWIIARTWSV